MHTVKWLDKGESRSVLSAETIMTIDLPKLSPHSNKTYVARKLRVRRADLKLQIDSQIRQMVCKQQPVLAGLHKMIITN